MKRGTTLAAISREAGLESSSLANALTRHWPKGERLYRSGKPHPIKRQRPILYASGNAAIDVSTRPSSVSRAAPS
ncbi:helix-turn-helix domain-containing protein [Brenneria sp. g21c3]|uniref:helix-turn-helix domain-containing protein n=1 Tax=Brenneria sp. g21c3 TaxID=3093893 RepID=UPI002EC5ACF3|nr:helix-turn-helix domain-containing protein [Brenneria sp. g21c3]